MLNNKSVYEHIHPKKFFKEHVLQGVRPDGRKLLGYRPVALNVDIVSKANASATLKIGSSVFICGINAEISFERPASSVLVTVSCPTLQAAETDSSLSDKLILCANLVSQVFKDQKVIDPKSLKPTEGHAYWVLYCDILCTNYDGALLDGTLMVLTASLKTLKLPKIQFYENSKNFFVDKEVLIPIIMDVYPVATTYGIFDESIILIDPSNKEEKISGLSQLTIITLGEDIVSVHKHGSAKLPAHMVVPCMNQALKRSLLVISMIDKVSSAKNG